MAHKGTEGGETELHLRTGLGCKRTSVAAMTFLEYIVCSRECLGFQTGSCKGRTVLRENDFGSGGFYSHCLGAETWKYWQMRYLTLNPQPDLSGPFPEF